jgi:hypothetical protein
VVRRHVFGRRKEVDERLCSGVVIGAQLGKHLLGLGAKVLEVRSGSDVFMTPPCIRPAVRKQAARRTASRLLLKRRRWVYTLPADPEASFTPRRECR